MNKEYKLCLLQVGGQNSIAKEVSASVSGHVHNYLNIKMFSDEIRFGKKDSQLAIQLEELVEARNTLLTVIEKAMQEQKSISLSVVINMEVSD